MHIGQTIIKKTWDEVNQKPNLIQIICKFTVTSTKLSNQLRISSHEVIVFQLLSANIGQLWLKIAENWSTRIDETTKNLDSRAERLSAIFG